MGIDLSLHSPPSIRFCSGFARLLHQSLGLLSARSCLILTELGKETGAEKVPNDCLLG